MRINKFNVSNDLSKRTFNNIVFDSATEMKYYKDVVLPQYESGAITEYELQKQYILQPSFLKNGKMVRAIVYAADFWYKRQDGHEVVIDIKGFADSVALLKRKMFWHCYPDVEYKWLSYSGKYGGWIDYDELKAKRRNAKKEKKNEKCKGRECGKCNECGKHGKEAESCKYAKCGSCTECFQGNENA